MAKPTEFKVLKTSDIKEAIKWLNKFDIVKRPLYEKVGQKYVLEENVEKLVRADNNSFIAFISPFYAFTHHVDVLNAAHDAISKLAKELGQKATLHSVAYDRGGAVMIAKFTINVGHLSTIPTLEPELIVVNSYNGIFGLGFELGFYDPHLNSDIIAKVTSTGLKSMRFGTAKIDQMDKKARAAMDLWQTKLHPLVESMKIPIKDLNKTLAGLENKKGIPRRLAPIIKEVLEKHPEQLTAWQLLQIVTQTINQQKDLSPLRTRELHHALFEYLSRYK